jgi:tRNA(fMet)-specific endonuclease VapC
MELILVLDTNAYSDWRRSGRWHHRISVANRILVPVTVIGELHHGFRKGSKFEENTRTLREFLAEPQVEVQPVTVRTAEIYGELVTLLQQQGTPLPTNDIWIAAATIEHGGRLVTSDEHFQHLPSVDLEKE